jgi:WD40 repeat protein
VCLSTDGTTILVGTKGCNIYEISAIDGSDVRGGPLAIGHAYGTINNLVVHPNKNEFITIGNDYTLRVFDSNLKSQLKIATFEAFSKAVAYNPTGDLIALGFCGPLNTKKCGGFVILKTFDLTMVYEAKDSASPISVVKFSPEGETLAVGTYDGSIHLYAVADNY